MWLPRDKTRLPMESATVVESYSVLRVLLLEPSFCRGGGRLHTCLQFLKWHCFSVRPPAAAQCVFVLEIWAWFSTTACTGLWSPCWEPSLTEAGIHIHTAYGLTEKYVLAFVCSFSHLPWRLWGWEMRHLELYCHLWQDLALMTLWAVTTPLTPEVITRKHCSSPANWSLFL